MKDALWTGLAIVALPFLVLAIVTWSFVVIMSWYTSLLHA